MFCNKCGVEMTKDGKFCPACGASVVVDYGIIKNSFLDNQKQCKYIIKCSNCGYEGQGKNGRRFVSKILAWIMLPFFWPITLLYYLFTKRLLCPECNSDFIGIKNRQGLYVVQQKGAKIFFIIFLCLIIIGILSSVVFASLNTAREKANQTKIIDNVLENDLYQELKQIEERTNSVYNLPVMIDEETELFRVYVNSDSEMNYYYRLVNYVADEIEWPVLDKIMSPSLKDFYCDNSLSSYYRENDVPMIWNYYDKYTIFIGEIRFSNSKCN